MSPDGQRLALGASDGDLCVMTRVSDSDDDDSDSDGPVRTATAVFVPDAPQHAGTKVQLWFFPVDAAGDEPASDAEDAEHLAAVRAALEALRRVCVCAPHAGLVPCLGLCVPPRDPLCLVAAHVPRETSLARRVAALTRAGREMPLAERVSVCTQVAAALQHLHRHGLVHGGLTPATVHLLPTEGGTLRCQLSGYGIAHVAALCHSSDSSDRDGDGQFLCFSAPEVLEDAENATTQSDVYSLGVLMLFMLEGGAAVLAGLSRAQLWQAAAAGMAPVAIPPTLRCEYGYARLLAHCCRADPVRRPPDPAAIFAQLRALLS